MTVLNVNPDERAAFEMACHALKMTDTRKDAFREIWNIYSQFYINDKIRRYAGIDVKRKYGRREKRNFDGLERAFSPVFNKWLNQLRWEMVAVYDQTYTVSNEVRTDWIESLFKMDIEEMEYFEIFKSQRIIEFLETKPSLLSFYKESLRDAINQYHVVSYGPDTSIKASAVNYFSEMGMVDIINHPYRYSSGKCKLTRIGRMIADIYFEHDESLRASRIAQWEETRNLSIERDNKITTGKQKLLDAFNNGEVKEEFDRGKFISKQDFLDFYGLYDTYFRTMELREFISRKTGLSNTEIPTLMYLTEQWTPLRIWFEPETLTEKEPNAHKSGVTDKSPEGFYRHADYDIEYTLDWNRNQTPYIQLSGKLMKNTIQKFITLTKITEAIIPHFEEVGKNYK